MDIFPHILEGKMELIRMFLTFAKIGVMTFGGGYAMLPILQREVVEKNGWATEEELTDYFAIGQCTPGIIAVNTATFIGHKRHGAIGGIVTTLGVVFPSLVIITAIAMFLTNFAEIPVVRNAIAGVNACVVALIASSVIKLGKSTLKNSPSVVIFLCILLFACVGNFVPFPDTWWGTVLDKVCSPVTLVVAAAVLGLIIWLPEGRRGGGGK